MSSSGNTCTQILKTHFRGIFGGLGIFGCLMVIIIATAVKGNDYNTIQSIVTKTIWFCMIWCFFWQPFDVVVTGMIPIFIYPMTGNMSTPVVITHYFNESIALYLFMRIIGHAMNQSGADRRIIMTILCSGSTSSFSLKSMILKTSCTSFLMCIFTNRQVTTPIIMDCVCGPIEQLQPSAEEAEPSNFSKIRYLLATVVHTSATLGSLVFIHNSPSMLLFRASFTQSAGVHYPDVFNYMRYTSFASPVVLIMLICNIFYHITLTKVVIKENMSEAAMGDLRRLMLESKQNIPPLWKGHEILAILFTVATLLLLIFRFPIWIVGWATKTTAPHVPIIQDTTIAAICILLLHMLPTNMNFCKVLAAKKKSDLPPQKATTGLLEWRFVDKKCNYAYLFLFGGSLALHYSFASGRCFVGQEISSTLNGLSNMPPLITVIILMLLTVIFCNVMTGVAAAACIMPIALFLHVSWTGEHKDYFIMKPYLAPFAVCFTSCLGFMAPFENTPAFYSRAFGKVPIPQMIKWGIGSVIICFVILVPAVTFYAPMIFGEFLTNIKTKA